MDQVADKMLIPDRQKLAFSNKTYKSTEKSVALYLGTGWISFWQMHVRNLHGLVKNNFTANLKICMQLKEYELPSSYYGI